MQSQGSTSSQPSFDSLSPSDSPFFSDSEPADDDTDVFLTDSSSSLTIGGTGANKAPEERGSKSPRSQWTCNGFKDKETDEESRKSRSGSKAAQITLDETDPIRQNQKSQGDLLFAQKVRTCSQWKAQKTDYKATWKCMQGRAEQTKSVGGA